YRWLLLHFSALSAATEGAVQERKLPSLVRIIFPNAPAGRAGLAYAVRCRLFHRSNSNWVATFVNSIDVFKTHLEALVKRIRPFQPLVCQMRINGRRGAKCSLLPVGP